MSFKLKDLEKFGKSYNLIALVFVIAVAGIALAMTGGLGQNIAGGFTTAYEGVKPSFYGVYYDGFAYEGTAFRGTQMDFDVDEPELGLPDLEGEMTSIFLPIDIGIGDIPDWVPQSRAIALENANTDPVNEYEWVIDDKAYRMEEYDLKWFMSVEAGFDSTWGLGSEAENQRWRNAEIWVRLDTSPDWIFEGADETYFTVAKITVDYVEKQGHDTGRIDVSPESQGTAMSLFYMPYGEGVNLDEEDFRGFAVGDSKLNPAIFRSELYTVFRLDDFGSQAWWEGISRKYESDVVTWELTVTVFVVGEWDVKDIQDISELTEGGYGREVKVVTTGVDIDWEELFSAENKLLMGLVVIALIAGTVIIGYGLAQGYGAGLARKGAVI